MKAKGRPESELHHSAPREGARKRRPFRLLALCAAATLLASGCALQDTRYDYSRNGLPFADYDESILDWNFPTSTSQGPLTAPERIVPWRPAIGVPWANGDPNAWRVNQTPASDSVREPSAESRNPDEAPIACDGGCAAPGAPLLAPHAAADPGVRGVALSRTR